MDFSLSEEQRLLQDSVRKFVQNSYEFSRRRTLAASPEGFSREHWKTFAELGWLAVPFAEELGGLGGSLNDVAILLEEFGKGLVLEPYVSTVMLAGGALSALASDAQKERYIPAIIDGSLLASLADAEAHTRGDVRQTRTTARAVAGGYVLDGQKSLVLHGGSADVVLVVARLSGVPGDAHGLGVFAVSRDAAGLSVRDYPLIDGGRAADLQLQGVHVQSDALLGGNDDALAALQPVIDQATIALCAEAVGVMESTWRNTVDYCKTRKQFGVAIGNFQVLQHRMANMFMAHEQTRSLLLMATLTAGEGEVARVRAVSSIKALVGKWGRQIGQEAIQLHGGMGMSDEMAIGHFFKRLTAIDAIFGNADAQLDRYAALIDA